MEAKRLCSDYVRIYLEDLQRKKAHLQGAWSGQESPRGRLVPPTGAVSPHTNGENHKEESTSLIHKGLEAERCWRCRKKSTCRSGTRSLKTNNNVSPSAQGSESVFSIPERKKS